MHRAGLPVIVHVVDLPFPPSTNSIWRKGKGRMHLSVEYRQWKMQADLVAIASKTHRGSWHKIMGRFSAEIALSRQHRHGNADADNRIKAVLDWAQSRELVANDKHLEELTIRWADPGEAPEGCRLTLRELGQ